VGFGTRASRAIADRDREARRDDRHVVDADLVPVPFTEWVPSIGLELTHGQRALSRVAFDGLEPADVHEDADVVCELFGGISTIPGMARRLAVLRLGRGSGKTTLASAFALYTMLTADCSQAGPGDMPAVITIAPTKRTAQLSVSMAMSFVEQSDELRPIVLHANSEGFSLRRHDGRRVQFRALPKSRGGAAARGMSILGAIFDEAEFLPNEELAAAAVTDRELVQSITPRLMRSGRIWLISTPWPTMSLAGELFDANFGRPTTALCARAPTLVMRDYDPDWAERIESERLRDPANAAREFDCINVSSGAAFFDAEQIQAAVFRGPLVYSGSRKTSVGTDAAFKGDSSTLVAVERQGDRLVVVRVEERRPSKDEPLAPSKVVGEFAAIAKSLDAHELVCDGHYIESIRELAATSGVQAILGPMNVRGKERVHIYVRDLLREGKLVLPDHPKLLAQLRAVRSREQPGGGMSIASDRTAAGHGDLVSALVQACFHDRRFGQLGAPAATRTEFTVGTSRGAPLPVRGRFNGR